VKRRPWTVSPEKSGLLSVAARDAIRGGFWRSKGETPGNLSCSRHSAAHKGRRRRRKARIGASGDGLSAKKNRRSVSTDPDTLAGTGRPVCCGQGTKGCFRPTILFKPLPAPARSRPVIGAQARTIGDDAHATARRPAGGNPPPGTILRIYRVARRARRGAYAHKALWQLIKGWFLPMKILPPPPRSFGHDKGDLALGYSIARGSGSRP